MPKPIPDGFTTITSHLIVSDVGAALDFYQKAFKAEETGRMALPGGGVLHGGMRIGNSMVMLGKEFPPMSLSPKSRGGTTVALHVYVENADAAFDRAVKEGCTVVLPMRDQFWGDRYGQVEDPFGHRWSFATHTKDFTPEQVVENAKAAFANMPGCK